VAQHVRAIKSRIGNIENIRQITKAMNAIAMTKLTRIKRRLAGVRPYVDGLERFVADLLGRAGDTTQPHPLTVSDNAPGVGILVLNADRGLCGRFKGEVNAGAERLLEEVGVEARLLIGGEKARTHFDRHSVEPLRIYTHVYEEPTAEIARRIAADLISLCTEGVLGRVVVVYMRFLSDLIQRLTVEEILPLAVEPRAGDAIIEPDLTTVLNAALPAFLEGRVYRLLLETKTSEHAIRRQAMKNATENADDLLTTLTRAYNRARQQSITREIADIMGGAEALREG